MRPMKLVFLLIGCVLAVSAGTVRWTPNYQPVALAGNRIAVTISNPTSCDQVVAVQTEGVLQSEAFAARFKFSAMPNRRTPSPVRDLTAIESLPVESVRDGDGFSLRSESCKDQAILLFVRVPAGSMVSLSAGDKQLHSAPLFDDLLVRNGSVISRSIGNEHAAISAVTMPGMAPPASGDLLPRKKGIFYVTRSGWHQHVKHSRPAASYVDHKESSRVFPVRAAFSADGKLVEIRTLAEPASHPQIKAILTHAMSGVNFRFQGSTVANEMTVPFYVDERAQAVPHIWLPTGCVECPTAIRVRP